MDEYQFRTFIEVFQKSHSIGFFEIVSFCTATIISILTLLVTLSISKKVNLRSGLAQKQLDVVYDLITSLQNTFIPFILKDKSTPLGTAIRYYDLINYRGTFHSGDFEDFEKFMKRTDIPLFFTEYGYSQLKFVNYYDNPFLPAEIAKELENFVIKIKDEFGEYDNYEYFPFHPNDDQNFILIEDFQQKIFDENGNELHIDTYRHFDRRAFKIKGKSIFDNLKSFQNKLISLNNAIEKWLSEYDINNEIKVRDSVKPAKNKILLKAGLK